jgi:hypothetical protein
MVQRTTIGFAVAALAVGPCTPASAQTIRSAYTDHDYERCREIPQREAHMRDVVTERHCDGHGGIRVTWINGPDSSTLAFGTSGLVGDYGDRFSFAVAGNRIEWRGPATGGRVEPFAAIARFQLCRSVSGPCRSELVVFRLDGTRRSCVAASVDGTRADANERARALADDVGRRFRCGADRPHPPE